MNPLPHGEGASRAVGRRVDPPPWRGMSAACEERRLSEPTGTGQDRSRLSQSSSFLLIQLMVILGKLQIVDAPVSTPGIVDVEVAVIIEFPIAA